MISRLIAETMHFDSAKTAAMEHETKRQASKQYENFESRKKADIYTHTHNAFIDKH